LVFSGAGHLLAWCGLLSRPIEHPGRDAGRLKSFPREKQERKLLNNNRIHPSLCQPNFRSLNNKSFVFNAGIAKSSLQVCKIEASGDFQAEPLEQNGLVVVGGG
jgi:hypothetical protein